MSYLDIKFFARAKNNKPMPMKLRAGVIIGYGLKKYSIHCTLLPQMSVVSPILGVNILL